MTELINLFGKLSEFFEPNLVWEQIEELYEKTAEEKDKTSKSTRTPNEKQQQCQRTAEREDDEPLAAIITNDRITSLPLIRRALQNPQVLSTLLELCTTIRSLRESNASYDNTYDCWDQVVKVTPRDSYLAFIYSLAGLVTLDSTSMAYTKLSLAAVNTYFLSLTIPGAKGFHIFEEEVITHCLQVFTLVENIQSQPPINGNAWQQLVEKWVRFVTLCDDLKLLLRYVHFNEYKSTRDTMMKKLIDIQYLNHERGYANMYAANLHTTCFEIFEEMINAHNGEPEETLMKLMNMTVFLHTYPPKPKYNAIPAVSTGGDCEHISDWFIKCIAKYPRLLVKVLSFYIECIVTNPIKTWKTEQTQRALEYGAKYDAALFTKCNESCVEFLCDAVYAEETMIRSRAIELMLRILQVESSVDWQMFRHEVSDIPREVHLIKELIDSLQDNNNNIKLKAVQALHVTLTKGSPNAMKILTEGLRFVQLNDINVVLPIEPRIRKNEIRYEKPVALVPQYTYEGHGIIELSFMHLPEYIYTHIFRSSLSYIRRAGIMFMEHIVKLNPLVIFNTNFVTETTRLVDEPTTLVRKQTLLTVDAILACYPNCFPVIWVWCKIIAPMLHDADPKNIELAMDCFRSRVLLNMRGIDQSNKAEHFMPWVIIRTMLSTQSRLYLQTCFHLALQQRMLNTQILSTIESHLLTSNSTEAWIVLNFISGKIKSKEPDALIHLFTSLHSWNKEQNMLIALEVLANCIHDFSHTALNHAFNHIVTSIREGKILPVLIGKAFDFLVLIDNRSQRQESQIVNASTKTTPSSRDKTWIIELHDLLEYNILTGIADFPENRSTLISHLYSYSEVNLQTRLRPHRTIISFIHKYMSECIKLPERELDLDNERLFNSMILISGRFSLRDACVANTTCTLYGGILKNIDRPPIVNTIIVSITDVCKKHTQIVESILERVMQKLSSPFAVNRIETFKCFEKLVLQDQLKLRGSLLLALLSTILDDNQELATRAREFFSEFLSKKNSTLFQKCLIECPFVLNEYQNFDGLDSFSETAITSPLKGERKRKSRQLLYNHLMSEIDEINLVTYFGQLKLIAEKSQRDPLIQTPAGIALVQDVIFILKRVCQLTKEDKQTEENKDNSESRNDEPVTEISGNALQETEDNLAANTEAVSTAVTTGKVGRGRGRRREVTTMTDALNLLEKSLIFIPTIYNNIHHNDDTMEKCFDELGKALAKRFPNLIDYAQPAKFWNKYRKSKVTANMPNNKKTKKRRLNVKPTERNTSENEGTESEESDLVSDDDDDADFQLISKKSNVTPSKHIYPTINCAELPMTYLFNPNI